MALPKPSPLAIDPETGHVRLGDHPAAITPAMSIGALREHFASWVSGGRDIGNGYEWVSLSHVRLADRPAGMSLCFFEGRLTMLTLGVTLPDDEEEEGWPTEGTSLRHVAFLKRALERLLGRSMTNGSVQFGWGGGVGELRSQGVHGVGGGALRAGGARELMR
ncbi:hypothetical protein [Piscinibacter gummiphilus]|uniref:hypothetical protein n=1 Tax=Piscinibacter gummiphilus TaxID=946333 RepID=UPI0012F500A1|nr:hypothetical protein [Piscinibacter gummiphilus]